MRLRGLIALLLCTAPLAGLATAHTAGTAEAEDPTNCSGGETVTQDVTQVGPVPSTGTTKVTLYLHKPAEASKSSLWLEENKVSGLQMTEYVCRYSDGHDYVGTQLSRQKVEEDRRLSPTA